MAVIWVSPNPEWEIGAAVLDVREAARLNQRELAELVEPFVPRTSKQTISNIERGYSGATLNRIKAIASACAGRGWLPDEANLLERYILGYVEEVPITMKRSRAEAREPEPSAYMSYLLSKAA